MSNNTNFHIAVGFELGLPTGDSNKGMSEGVVVYEPFVIAAKDFPGMNNLQIFSQVEISLVKPIRPRHDLESEERGAHELNWNAGFLIPVRRVCITTEFSWVGNEWDHTGNDNRHSLTPGLVWRLPDNFEIGIGVPISLSRKSPEPGMILKLTREF